jgi:hypothetical protein
VHKFNKIDIFATFFKAIYMIRTIKFLLILLLASHTVSMNAHDDEMTVKIRTGHNASFGGFGAVSLETVQNFDRGFQLSGGIQYNTIGRTALEARPAWSVNYNWGVVSAEALLTYRHLASVNSFAAGAGASISGKWVGFKLGYYYHMYGHGGESINEPFNIYYELLINLLPMVKAWDLQLAITNSEIFELERHYQPTFIAQCRYDLNERLGFSMGIGCKPAGMFHLSADYYQSFLNLGVCYKW